MNRRTGRIVALVSALAAAALAATASPAGAAPASAFASPGQCALTQSPLRGFDVFGGSAARAGEREPSAWKNAPIEEAPVTNKRFKAVIPVYFHIFTDGATGNLTDAQLRDQISVLNAGFGGFEGGAYTGLSFKLAGAERIDNANWFYNLTPSSSVEREAKSATHVGDAATLNIWTTNGPGYLGFATFPSWYKRAPQLDGIVIDYNSLKGGAYGSAFSLAKTATHEAGHWAGLLHTFQGGCNDKGDYVDDTPAMLVPTSGCPEGKDTCPEPGTDPIHNYMDYSYDSCYDQFTVGQATRIQNQWGAFRAGGGTSVGQ
jgi:Pregnancy-associated plasma protein-A